MNPCLQNTNVNNELNVNGHVTTDCKSICEKDGETMKLDFLTLETRCLAEQTKWIDDSFQCLWVGDRDAIQVFVFLWLSGEEDLVLTFQEKISEKGRKRMEGRTGSQVLCRRGKDSIRHINNQISSQHTASE